MKKTQDGWQAFSVSIPVRVLDVLKHKWLQTNHSEWLRFNPCKGFRCFEALVFQYLVSHNKKCFNPCKGFRCFEAFMLLPLH